MQAYNIMARIHSLNGNWDEIKVVEKKDGNNYIVEYKGQLCTAIFNGVTNCFYVDDKYGVIKKD